MRQLLSIISKLKWLGLLGLPMLLLVSFATSARLLFSLLNAYGTVNATANFLNSPAPIISLQ